ncbi:Gx transporter family protein [Proteiniclasticum sediminis]|nr:Gx transporter family protein [Proteiniclasticum sediminis]
MTTSKTTKMIFIALIVVILRVALATMFGGTLSSFMFSLSGGILSLVMMFLVKTLLKDKVSIIGISGAGAVSHNIGQLLVASYIVRNFSVMLYLPVMTFIGIGTGIFIGIAANYIIGHMSKIKTVQKISLLKDEKTFR